MASLDVAGRTLRLAVVVALLVLTAWPCRPVPLFERVLPEDTGVGFSNAIREDSLHNAVRFDYLYNGGGVAAGDFDGDGMPDLYFTGNMVTSRLYLNRGDFRFEDVTDAAHVGTEVWANGAAAVDVNDDGLLDIYIAVGGHAPPEKRRNLLFINQGLNADGVPVFAEEAEQYGLADEGFSTHAAFLDYDGDGDLDVYVLNNSVESGNKNAVRPRLSRSEHVSTDRLYRNEGGRFTDVSSEAGITIEGYGLGVVVSDFNRDGLPDIYAANDFITNDLLYINNGDGTFTDRASEWLKHQSHSAMGVDAADYNNDGWPDLFILDMLPPDHRRRKLMLPGMGIETHRRLRELGYAPQYMHNTLQLNSGRGPDGAFRFSEISRFAGVDATDWSWSVLMADFDNDGWKDAFVTNGYRLDLTNLDFIVESHRVAMMGTEQAKRDALMDMVGDLDEVHLSNVAFRNAGNLTFADETRRWGLDGASFSNGAAYADLDLDGDLDLVVNNLDGPASLWRNRSERRSDHGYLRIEFIGAPGNRAAVGAHASVTCNGVSQYVEHYPQRGYLSTVQGGIHFGLGGCSRIDSVVVVWPDGRGFVRRDVEPNQVLRVDYAEAEASAEAPSASIPFAAGRPMDRGRSSPLFERLDTLHVHRGTDPAELRENPLLPHSLSALGPALAVADVDNNGLDDLFAAGGSGQSDVLYLQTAAAKFDSIAVDPSCSAGAAHFFDADADGYPDLYVACSDGSRHRLYVNDGAGALVQAVLPPVTAPHLGGDGQPDLTVPSTAVTSADFDGDGDLDLFVGGRVDPGRYPHPPRSFLLRNESSSAAGLRFSDVTTSVAPAAETPGLVTDALFSDFDGDGRPDLVLAGEWMSILFLRNTGDRLEPSPDVLEPASTTGWWTALAAGDFDGDGDVDYLAGNSSLNLPYRATKRRPLRLYAADFDRNGTVDPLLTHVLQDRRHLVAPLDVLLQQIPGMRRRFPTYASFADARLEQVLSGPEREQALVLEAATLSSVYLRNEGSHFEQAPLPGEAQFAPIQKMLVADFDSDGRLDVLAAGNLFDADPTGGRRDAGNGLMLRGDGTGQFSAAGFAATGFRADGDARDLAMLRAGPRGNLIVAAERNGSIILFKLLERDTMIAHQAP